MSRCAVIPRGKTCPASLRQPTAESLMGVRDMVWRETLDERIVAMLRGAVRSVLDRWREKRSGLSPVSNIIYIIGKWGYGKSHYARILQDIASEMGVHTVYVTFDTLIEEARRREWRSPSELRDRIAEILTRGAPTDRPVIAVLDEFESLVTAHWVGSPSERILIDAFIELYQALVNPGIPYYSELRGRLNLALLLTPAAIIRFREILRPAMKEVKIESRHDYIITIRPMTKWNAVRLVLRYLEVFLGVEPENIMDTMNYINTLYYVTGGAPRVLLSLLREIARHAERKCHGTGECCVCPLTPAELVEALSNTTLIGPEGNSYKPARQLLASLAHTLGDRVRPLLTLEPVDKDTASAIRGYGVPYEPVRAYQDMEEAEVSRWIDMVTAKLCGGDGECVEELTHILQHLTVYTGGSYTIVLPPTREQLMDWLHLLGWTTGRLPRGLSIDDIQPASNYTSLYALGPRGLRLLYNSPGEGILDFILDPQLRSSVQHRLDRLLEDYDQLQRHAAEGLWRLLVLREASVLPGVVVEGGELYYRYEEGGVTFLVPLEIVSPGGEPRRKNSVVVMVSRGGRPGVEGRVLTVSLREGELRLLAAVALALRGSGDPSREIDFLRLEELGRRIIETHDLAAGLRLVVESLIEMGVLVRPLDHSDIFGGRNVDERFRAIEDTMKFLAVLGGKSRFVSLRELTGFVWVLAYATPYGKAGKGWCGIDFVEIGRYSDIKDPETPERLEKILARALNALLAEGLVEKVQSAEGPAYRLRLDSIAGRLQLAGEALEGGQKVFEGLLVKLFVLPADRTNRMIALRRLVLRRLLLNYLDYSKRTDYYSKLKNIMLAYRLPRKIEATLYQIEETAQALEEAAGTTGTNALGTIIYCKGAGRGDKASCKTINIPFIKNLSNTLYNQLDKLLQHPNAPVQQSLKYFTTLEKLGSTYLSIISRAAEILHEELTWIEKELVKLHDNAKKLANTTLDPALHNLITAIIEEEIAETRREARHIIRSLVEKAEHDVQAAQSNKKDVLRTIAQRYNYTQCKEKTHEEAAKLYNPLVRALTKDETIQQKLVPTITAKTRTLSQIATDLEKIATLTKTHGLDTRLVSAQIIDKYERLLEEGKPPLQALAMAVTAAANYLEVYHEEYKLAARTAKRIEHRLNSLATNIDNTIRRLETLAKNTEKLPRTTSTKQTIQEIRRKTLETIRTLETLQGLLNQAKESCTNLSPTKTTLIEQCRELTENLEKRYTQTKQQADKLAQEYNNTLNTLAKETARQLENLRRLIKAAKEAYLHELQKGNTKADRPVRLLAKALNTLETTPAPRTLQDIITARRIIEEARKLYHEARQTPGPSKLETLMEIIDNIEKQKRITLSQLLQLIRKHAQTPAQTLQTLEELDRMAKALGLNLTITIE